MRRWLVTGLIGLAALAVVAWGAWAWYQAVTWVTTDDAYVEGTISPVSAKVAGHLVEVLVRDNQAVRKGDLLVRVDPRDYQARRDQAQAAVATAEADVRAARAELPLAREGTRATIDQSRAALEVARVAVRSSEASVDEARARLEARRAAALASRADLAAARSTHRMTQREVERVRRLVTHDYVSRRELDAAEAAFESAVAGVEAAERRFAQAEREAQQAEAELAARRHGVDQSRQRVAEARAALARSESQVHQVSIKDAEASRALARLKQAQADLAFAQLQLDHAEVRAPLDGIVSKKSAEPGQVVQPGQPLLALVPLHDVWVVANFKETQLRGIRPGMPAQVTVDTYPGRVFTGAVDSLAAGTGSRFSLLPPENATGNWVKVVQRVPVKIRIEGGEIGNPQPLRAGMSAVVTIRIR